MARKGKYIPYKSKLPEKVAFGVTLGWGAITGWCIPGRLCSPVLIVWSLAEAGMRALGNLTGEVGMERAVFCVVRVGCGISGDGLTRFVGRREVFLDVTVLPCATAMSGESCLLKLPAEVDADGPC